MENSHTVPHGNRAKLQAQGAVVAISWVSVAREPGEALMDRIAIGALLILVSLAACTHVRPSASPTAPAATARAAPTVSGTSMNPAAPVVTPAPVATSVPERPSEPATEASGALAAQAQTSTGKAPVTRGAPSATTKAAVADTAKTAPPRASGAVKATAKDEHAASPEKEAGAAPAAQKPAASLALDLAALEQRLRDTRAIGVFTKLSLKNQVDDLLSAFRAFHNGQPKATLADLRQRYDLLLLKVLSLLQDGDPPLAAAISASRDAIWGILVDPEKFQTSLAS